MTDALPQPAPDTPAPAVSVVMPVYNALRYLHDAVTSILQQTFRDFEFIILDDGSTDGSLELLKAFAAADRRVRLIAGEHVGYVELLNRGLAMARADLVARMDADDFALPQRLEKQVAYLREHPDCVLVGSQVIMMDKDSLPIAEMPGIPLEHEKIDEYLMLAGWPIVHPAVAMRRDAVLAAGCYDPAARPHEDHDLFLKLAERGRLANLPEVLLRYRRHYESVIYSEEKAGGKGITPLVAAARQRRGLPPAPPEPWRDVVVPQSQRLRKQRQTWCWWALKAGNIKTARKHALALVRSAPFDLESWRVMYCAVRGR